MTGPYAEVIGDPVNHSKSPIIHNFWIKHLNLQGDYRVHHVTGAQLGPYLAERADDPDWRGCNVTIPHKIAIMDHVEDPGSIRTTIGAMNTVLREPSGALKGANTDAAGFYVPLADMALAGQRAAVIGSGGAARAILFALARAEIGHVTLVARDRPKAVALLAHFGLSGDVQPLDARLPDVALLVNATQLGMVGQPALEPDLSPLGPEALVYDVVYAPLETALLAAARSRGLRTLDGLEMLVGQAALAFELFFGVAPPRERDAELRALLAG